MRRHSPRPLSVALERLAGQLAPATPLARVQLVWAEAVGDAVAREAQPVAMRDATLTVACHSAVWAQELDLMSSALTGALNEALGEPVVAALRCRADGAATRS